MRIESVCSFLETVPRYKPNGDETQVMVKCPFCGDSTKSDHPHLSIKVDVEPGEPMMYKCFRAVCGKTGILTTDILQMLGCSNVSTLMELAQYNSTINKRLEKGFNGKTFRNYELVNLNRTDNKNKLEYINNRLGVHFETGDLRDYRIQLSLYDFLNLNSIHKLAFPKDFCDKLDTYTISFLSMYKDYLICRDLTKDLKTGRRYTMYRASGKPNPEDMKVYCIPTEIDLMDPHPACINVAEGPFSILGAYLHTTLGRDEKNSLFLANCGSEYTNTIQHVVKQYGLLDVKLHIWSDSEIGMKKYETLLASLTPHMHICSIVVHYNEAAEDFGHPKNKIHVRTVALL